MINTSTANIFIKNAFSCVMLIFFRKVEVWPFMGHEFYL